MAADEQRPGTSIRNITYRAEHFSRQVFRRLVWCNKWGEWMYHMHDIFWPWWHDYKAWVSRESFLSYELHWKLDKTRQHPVPDVSPWHQWLEHRWHQQLEWALSDICWWGTSVILNDWWRNVLSRFRPHEIYLYSWPYYRLFLLNE